MKKFTFLMIALLTAVVTFAAGPKKQFVPQLFTHAKAQVQLNKQFRAKQTPARMTKQTRGTAMAHAPYFMPGSTLTPTKAPAESEVVVAPDGLETEEYAMTYSDYYGNDASASVKIGFADNDVYFQGLNSYLPEAWVMGTLENGIVTLAGDQYFGTYGSYEMYLQEDDYQFAYDAESGEFTGNGLLYTYTGDNYADYYDNPVLKMVVEQAATPADPAITALQNGDYGWYITFNVPNVDVDGNGMVISKLSYIIYTDTEGEIAPLTFTPETSKELTENMTEIPYGFTENWDFYDTVIYLNDLYSAEWNNIGIQSIYRGGGDENATEIQWYHIKDYKGPQGCTFNFNALPEDWPCSTGTTNDGDITEDADIVEGNVTLTVSPSTTSTPNRYWNTNNGIQLRVYGGTLTFTASEGYTMTAISIDAPTWGSSNTFSPESEIPEDEETVTDKQWYGNAQTVVLNVAAKTFFNSITVTVMAIPDELVTLPEGVEPEEFTLTLDNNYGISEATKLVAFDAGDVYVQGLASYFPEAFVKGTLNENGQYVFKSGQFVGENDESGAEYLIGLSVDEEGYLQYEPEFVFDFDAESRKLSLVEGTYFGESSKKNDAYLWTYTYSAVYTEGALVLPDLVELPEDVEAETWYLVANGYTAKVKGEEVGVAVDGSDIYLQGLCSSLPDAWVKGTIEDGKATFAGGQFYGTYVEEYEGEEYSYNLFFGGYGIDEETDETYLSDVVFDYDAEAGTLTTEDYILLNSSANYVSFYDYYENVSITRDMPELPQPLEAPEDLVTEPYMFTAFNTYFEEDMTPYQVKVGFYGDNEVYIQGLSTYIEDAWVKGTLENGVLTIPETYLGEYEGWGTADLYFSETEFIYDAEAGKFTSEAGFTTYDDDAYAYDEVSNVVLTKLVEKAIAPADPLVKNFVLIGVDDDNNTTDADGNPIFFAYPWMGLDIPVVDVDGDPLLQDKLSYVVYIVDENDIQKELTLTTDLYTGLEEDMTEIPYLFTDGYDIFTGGNPLYLEQDPEEIITWKKIGVQSIYRGLGEENRSNIGWFDITDYLAENNITVGIRDINAGSQKVVCFDLQGRRVAAPGKGLYIVNGKKMVLK